jgi:hypothetical protein
MRVNLLGGTYLSRSLIANAQSCVNLYPEKNPQDASAPYTHLLTPGLTLKKIALAAGPARGMYTATNGFLYYVVGLTGAVYYIDQNFNITQLGSLNDGLSSLCGFQDNGNVLVIVNGQKNAGWAIQLASGQAAPVNSFAAVTDPNFLGAVAIGYVDTFLVNNVPGTRQWQSSLSNITYASLTGTGANAPGAVLTGNIQTPGSGGTNGSYPNVALSGGNGAGATATLTVSGGAVTVVDFTGAGNSPGAGYQAGDILTSAAAGLPSPWNFQVLTANPVGYDPLFVANKTGYPDLLSTLVVVHREIWLLGAYETAEVWYDAGGSAFPFQIMPGVFLQHGCLAAYSVAVHDLSVFWLSIDSAGEGTIFQGEGYEARRISTWAIANKLQKAVAGGAILSDAVGMIYKQQDHTFYVLTFPSADFTLVYDVQEELWHERAWTDPASGLPHRVRFNCCALAYNVNVCGDWQNGNIYTLDLAAFTDNGAPIVRTRSFPHLLNDGKRVSYDALRLDMECGNGYPAAPGQEPLVTLQVSDDRGRTFWNAPTQSLGRVGEYLVQPQWRQLGLARDRVFQVSWSEGVFTSLQGAWLDVTPSET